MKAKQVLAKVFASAMVFSTLFGTSVMADKIDGDTIYIDQEIIDVTLPTTASQKFYIDPQGLIAVGKGAEEPGNTGTVVGASEMYAVNNSSIPLALSVSYELIDSAESDGVTVVTSTTDGSEIKAAATKSIAVSVSAEEDQGTSEYTGHVYKDGGSGTNITSADAALTDADVVYATEDTGATAAYFMTPATYKVQLKSGKTTEDAYDSSAYEYVRDEDIKDASRVKLTIGGYCSEKADWSDYAAGRKTLKLDVVFKFNKVTTTTGDYDDTEVDTGNEVQVGPKVTITDGGLVTLSGLTPEKTIKATADVVLVSPSKSYPLSNTNSVQNATGYTAAEGGTLTYQLNTSLWRSAIEGQSVKIEVTLSDGSKITSNSVVIDYD